MKKQCFVLHLPKKGRSIQLDFQKSRGKGQKATKKQDLQRTFHTYRSCRLSMSMRCVPFYGCPNSKRKRPYSHLPQWTRKGLTSANFLGRMGWSGYPKERMASTSSPSGKWSSSCRSLFDVRGFPSEPIFRRPYALPAPNSCQFPVPGPQASSRA